MIGEAVQHWHTDEQKKATLSIDQDGRLHTFPNWWWRWNDLDQRSPGLRRDVQRTFSGIIHVQSFPEKMQEDKFCKYTEYNRFVVSCIFVKTFVYWDVSGDKPGSLFEGG